MRVLALFLMVACGDAASPTAVAPKPAAEAPAGHDHSKMGHDAPPSTGAAPDHAAMGHSAPDHMAKMAATRDALRAELKEAYDAPVAGLDVADRVVGKAMFELHCASCHGAGGKGNGPAAAGMQPVPSDFTDGFHARYYSDAGRIHIMRKGSPDTAMAGFEGTLSAQQLLEVYAYVRTLRDAPAQP